MALVILGRLLTACALLYQEIYTLRTGRANWFFQKPAASQTPLEVLSRLAYASVYLFPAIAIIVILATALVKPGLSRVETWVIGNSGMLFGPLLFSIIGLLHLVQPEKMLGRTIRTAARTTALQ